MDREQLRKERRSAFRIALNDFNGVVGRGGRGERSGNGSLQVLDFHDSPRAECGRGKRESVAPHPLRLLHYSNLSREECQGEF